MGKRLRAFPVDSQIARNAFNLCTKDMFSVSENVQAEMDVDVKVYPGSYTMKNGISRTYFRMDGSIRGLKNIRGLKGVSELHFGEERTQPKLSYRYELSQEQYVELASKGMFDESGEWQPSSILNNTYELSVVCPNVYVMSEQFQQTDVPIIFVEFPEMQDVEVWMEDDEEYGHTGIYYNFAEYQEDWVKRPPVKNDLDKFMSHDDMDMLFDEQKEEVQSVVEEEQVVDMTPEDEFLQDAHEHITGRRLKRLGRESFVELVAEKEDAVTEPEFIEDTEEEVLDDFESEVIDEDVVLDESNISDEDVTTAIEDERVEEQALKQAVQQVQEEHTVKQPRQTPDVKSKASSPNDTYDFI